jgi:hypothetical protein
MIHSELNFVFHDILAEPGRVWDISVDSFREIWSFLSPYFEADRDLRLTFDDGYLGAYEHALPLLSEHEISATWFVTTDWVGSAVKFLSWDHIRNLTHFGQVVGSHTCSHPSLLKVDERTLLRELVDSKARIEAEILRPCSAFAAPFGHLDSRVCRAAWRAGYRKIYSTIPGWNWQNRVFERRFTITQDTRLEDLEYLLQNRPTGRRVVALRSDDVPWDEVEKVAAADHIVCLSREAAEFCAKFSLVARSVLPVQPLSEARDLPAAAAQELEIPRENMQLEVLGKLDEIESFPAVHDIQVREAVPGDEIGISTLVSSIFRQLRSPIHVQWKNGPQPWQQRRPATVVAEKDGVLIGHIGVNAFTLTHRGREFVAYQAVDNCVSAFFRRQGVERRMLSLIAERVSSEGTFLFGFSNDLARTVTTRVLSAELAGNFRCLKKVLNPQKGGSDTFHDWSMVDLLSVEQLWRETLSPLHLSNVKSASYLRWRYQENPFFSFEVVPLKKSGRLKGIAIFRFIPTPTPHALLYDWIVNAQSSESQELLDMTELRARQLGCTSLLYWDSVASAHCQQFLAQGFQFAPVPPFQLSTFFPGNPSMQSAGLADPGIWRFSLGDSDL